MTQPDASPPSQVGAARDTGARTVGVAAGVVPVVPEGVGAVVGGVVPGVVPMLPVFEFTSLGEPLLRGEVLGCVTGAVVAGAGRGAATLPTGGVPQR